MIDRSKEFGELSDRRSKYERSEQAVTDKLRRTPRGVEVSPGFQVKSS